MFTQRRPATFEQIQNRRLRNSHSSYLTAQEKTKLCKSRVGTPAMSQGSLMVTVLKAALQPTTSISPAADSSKPSSSKTITLGAPKAGLTPEPSYAGT
ncbi:hypothetical protein GHT06_005446 [Daphnia sinensis]|uniref:Uncharacterized protein n=1 Tax=Daphnia sinensis TaxID=1820382 RepID=A0AAD5KFU2_9CRUS|nr:hypothetical protein GHT06_005446 [Daphnia sinensis]